LLDDPSGKCTEFEADAEKLHNSLSSIGVNCIELIPGRNDHDILEKFVNFFDEKGYITQVIDKVETKDHANQIVKF
jgi:hypothetical protein